MTETNLIKQSLVTSTIPPSLLLWGFRPVGVVSRSDPSVEQLEVAAFADIARVKFAGAVLAVRCHLDPAIPMVAVLAHALRVVLRIGVLAGCNLTDVLFLTTGLSEFDKLLNLLDSQLTLSWLGIQVRTLGLSERQAVAVQIRAIF